jgi:phage-related protein (TIGR01555 family)
MQARDGLGTAFASLGQGGFGGGYQQGPLSHFFALDLAFAAYLGSGLLQKVIDIPAADRTREWRDWQAEADQITAIEAEEKRLGLRAKIKAAEVLRGIGGGALILALPGLASEPAPVPARGQLQAVNVVSRKQLELVDIDDDLTSATYGEPRLFRFQARGSPVDIHPSRVIPFRGDAYPPMMAGLSADDLYWGRSRLVRVVNEVAKSDNAALWFSHLIRKAKLLRFGISNLGDYDQADLNSRVSLIAQSENLMNATIYNLPSKDGSGGESGGEKIDDYQVTWTGIPAIMDAFDQRVAAVADIPFTRLMGRSPAGMNATGEHDTANWYAAVGAAQELELRPCLERLDAVMLPSAGVPTKGLWWKFSPLGKPTPEQEATRFKTTVEALKGLQDTNAMPDPAFNAGVQGVIEANGWMPGSLPILAEMSEDERYGRAPGFDPNEPDPSDITQSGSGVEGGDPTSRQAPGDPMEAEPRRRAANDKATEAPE